MRHLLIIGGSKGIGQATLKMLIDHCKITNFSRSAPEFDHPNLTHYSVDILNDSLPELESLDGLVLLSWQHQSQTNQSFDYR